MTEPTGPVLEISWPISTDFSDTPTSDAFPTQVPPLAPTAPPPPVGAFRPEEFALPAAELLAPAAFPLVPPAAGTPPLPPTVPGAGAVTAPGPVPPEPSAGELCAPVPGVSRSPALVTLSSNRGPQAA